MRDYGKVHTSFWSSDDMRHLSDDARLLALYLLTGQHTNMIGCFRLPDGYITEDVNWPIERVSKGLLELSQRGFITRNPKSKWVFITNFMRWNAIDNVNQAVAALKLFGQIPDDFEAKPAMARVFIELMTPISEHKNAEKIKGWETLLKPFANRSVTSSSSSSSSSSRINPHSDAREENSAPPEELDSPPFPMNGNNFGKFQMVEGWTPGPDFVKSAALWGRSIGNGYSQPELAEFVTYWIAEGKVFQQAQWEQKFAQSIVKRRAIESKSGGNDGRIQQSANTGGRAVERIRAAIAAEREREGIPPVGNDGRDVFGSVGGKERDDAIIDLESSDWRAE